MDWTCFFSQITFSTYTFKVAKLRIIFAKPLTCHNIQTKKKKKKKKIKKKKYNKFKKKNNKKEKKKKKKKKRTAVNFVPKNIFTNLLNLYLFK